MTKTEFFNVAKAIGLLVLLFYGAIEMIPLFERAPHGRKVNCLVIYAIINGHRYEKFAEPDDPYKDLITFGDGTQISRSAVEFKTETIDADALSNAMRTYYNAQSQVFANPHP